MKDIIITALFLGFLNGCSDNATDTVSIYPTAFSGSHYPTAFQADAAHPEYASFAAGSHVLLNTSGGLKTTNEILTLHADQWSAERTLYWSDPTEGTQFTALYPVYDGLAYTSKELYQHQALEDVLYAQGHCAEAAATIQFQFKHLFARITLRVDAALQNGLQAIRLTTPVSVSQVIPETAQILLDTEQAYTSLLPATAASESYSFVIPPAVPMSITVHLQTADKTYTRTLPFQSYNSQQAYTYRIRSAEDLPGIATATDWIAFSRLINTPTLSTYNGKTLKDFGDTVDGVTTYRLLADIDFSKVDCTNLQHVGGQEMGTDRYFGDIFDGQGHTLSNLTVKSAYGTTGVFGGISSTGVVKNLHLVSCEATLGTTPGSKIGTALVAGCNHGVISNCSVTNGNINSSAQDSSTGGIAGNSTGSILNCYVAGSKLIANGDCGSIVGYSQGNILNCYAIENTVTSKSKIQYSGGISGCSARDASTHIYNCYVYNLKVSKANGGLFFGSAKDSTVDHCFYNIEDSKYASVHIFAGDNTHTRTGKIATDFTYQGVPLYQQMNRWITQTAPEQFPDHLFAPWHPSDTNHPAAFRP